MVLEEEEGSITSIADELCDWIQLWPVPVHPRERVNNINEASVVFRNLYFGCTSINTLFRL